MEVIELEKSLKMIKDAKLDIELLRRENEKKCMESNIKIDELQATIGIAEEGLEIGLKESGEKKLECKLGYVSYRTMLDKWEYTEKILWSFIASLPGTLKTLFTKVTVTIKKADLKKRIIDDNPREFVESKLINYEPGLQLYLSDKKVKGIEIKRQESKFNYKIK